MRQLTAAALLCALLLSACARPASNASPKTPQPVASQPAPTPTPAEKPAAPQESESRKEYREALELIGAGKYREARTKLEKVVLLEPQFAEAWNDLAFVRLKTFASAFSPHPALPGRGMKNEPAATAARQALAIRPGWAFAQYNLGMALLANGEYEAAVEPLKESARQQPDRPEPALALGLALMGTQRFDEAAGACRQALALDPVQKLAAACLDQLADGGAKHPASEAAIGAFRWDASKRDFLWAGEPTKAPASELTRISPPWTCGEQFASGFRKFYVDCGRDGWYYLWGAQSAEAGKTPAGVGIGTPLAEVTRLYGTPRRSQDRLFYLAGELLMVFQLDPQEKVFWFYFGHRTPYFVIDSLLKG